MSITLLSHQISRRAMNAIWFLLMDVFGSSVKKNIKYFYFYRKLRIFNFKIIKK